MVCLRFRYAQFKLEVAATKHYDACHGFKKEVWGLLSISHTTSVGGMVGLNCGMLMLFLLSWCTHSNTTWNTTFRPLAFIKDLAEAKEA